MKGALTILLLTFLIAFATGDVMAQQGEPTLTYELTFEREGFEVLQQQRAQRGISPQALSQWLSDYGKITTKQSGVLAPQVGARKIREVDNLLAQQGARLTIMSIDERGSITGEHSLPMRYSLRAARSGEPLSLGSMVSADALERVLGSLIADNTFVPHIKPEVEPALGGVDTTVIPADSFVGTLRDAKRLAVDGSRRVLRQATDGEHEFGLLLLITPDAEEFEADVQPAGVLFTSPPIISSRPATSPTWTGSWPSPRIRAPAPRPSPGWGAAS